MRKKLIVIAGATASGKTQLALQIAAHLNTKIISADSRQCYKEMTIGVAKPTKNQLEEVEHFFINSHSIHDQLTAADFSQLAEQYIAAIFSQNDVAVMVGGTGLYIKAFCDGLDEIPEIDETIQAKVFDDFKSGGIESLLEQMKLHDPKYMAQATNGEERNSHRLMRALIVKLSTGKSILDFRNKNEKQHSFDIHYFVIDVDKEVLHQRINERVVQMIEEGLIDEVKSLQELSTLKNLQTIGYQEIFPYLRNEISLDEAVLQLQQNTRQYAKRQNTWFKKNYPNDFYSVENIMKKIITYS